MSKISISSPFEGDAKEFMAEIDKIEKMGTRERKKHLAQISAERERMKERYIKQYGQDEWDRLQNFIAEKLK